MKMHISAKDFILLFNAKTNHSISWWITVGGNYPKKIEDAICKENGIGATNYGTPWLIWPVMIIEDWRTGFTNEKDSWTDRSLFTSSKSWSVVQHPSAILGHTRLCSVFTIRWRFWIDYKEPKNVKETSVGIDHVAQMFLKQSRRNPNKYGLPKG